MDRDISTYMTESSGSTTTKINIQDEFIEEEQTDSDVDPEKPDAHKKKKKIYRCKRCNKLCNSKNALHYHFLSHTGERPFKCNQCDKSFFASSALKVYFQFIWMIWYFFDCYSVKGKELFDFDFNYFFFRFTSACIPAINHMNVNIAKGRSVNGAILNTTSSRSIAKRKVINVSFVAKTLRVVIRSSYIGASIRVNGITNVNTVKKSSELAHIYKFIAKFIRERSRFDVKCVENDSVWGAI